MFSSWIIVVLVAATPSPRAVLDKVQKVYKSAGDLEASFSQSFTGGLRRRTTVESGVLWAKSDGRVRWEYNEPVAKYFIYDGKAAYFYEPTHSQVTIFDDFGQSDLAKALAFLLGRGKLLKDFDVENCSEYCRFATEHEIAIRLIPKKTMGNLETVILVVNKKTYRVSMSAMVDSLGYETAYRFKNVKFKAKLDAKRFDFKTPPGVQELRASAQLNKPELDDAAESEVGK
jgi:outer membrane lipoprotein carrier protein